MGSTSTRRTFPLGFPDGRMMQPLTSPLPAAAISQIDSQSVGHCPAWAQSITDAGPIDVSVCIANWNCREHLRACLTSLQDYPQGVRIETIVVDNGSVDGAPEMVSWEFPEVILIRNKANEGFSRANNQAAARARGRYVFFLNNDTVVPAYALRKLVDFADAHPEAGMIGPQLRNGRGELQRSFRRKPSMAAMLHRTSLMRWFGVFKSAYKEYRPKLPPPTTACQVEVLLGAAVLMRRDVFEECGRWDEDFRFGVEDVELSARVGRTHPLIHLPTVEVIHHGRISSRANMAFAAPNLLIGYVHYFRKSGAPRLKVFGYKLVLTLDAPLQLIDKSLQYLWRLVFRKRPRATKSALAASGSWHFLRHGLLRFWRT